MRVSGVRVVAALASVILVAGCGTTVAGSSTGSASPPVLRIGAGGGAPVAAKISSAAGLGGFRVDGVLPAGPARSSTYRVAAAGAAGVRHVAAALGLSAAPRRHAHGWVVTARGIELRMRDTGQWSVRRVADACPPYQTDVDSADGSSGVSCAVAVDVGVVPPKPGSAPTAAGATPAPLSADQLRKVADPLLTALGLDPKTAVTNVPAAMVSLDPVVAGLRTQGYGTELAVDARGLRGGTGWAYPTQPSVGDSYPLISARAALKLLAAGPRPMMGAPEMACPVSTPAPVDLPPVCGGTTVVTGGRLGLELRWDGGYDGHPVLVPAWFLDVRGSDVPLVLLALSPKYLADPVMPTAGPGTTGPNPVSSAVAPPGSSGSGGGSTGSTGSAEGSGPS